MKLIKFKKTKSTIKDVELNPEDNQRNGKTLLMIVKIIAILFASYHLLSAATGFQAGFHQRVLHLGFASILTFLLYPLSKRWGKNNKMVLLIDCVFIACVFAASAYIFYQYNLLRTRAGSLTNVDMLFGTITILFVLEATRRLIGKTLSIIALVFILYALFGNSVFVPEMLQHSGFSLERIIQHLYMTTEGIFGMPLSVSASFVSLFVIFGAFLNASGAGRFIIDLVLSVFGRFTGGPAKVAVVSSALFGSISGSAVANVAGTGTFTIPMMKRLGFKPHVAAGIEATASTGGQFTPPIMGAAAFIIAQTLGIPYVSVIVAAIIPALLYYLSVFMMVDFEVRKTGIGKMKKEELPDGKRIFKEKWNLIFPPIVLIYFLVYLQTSEAKAAFWAIVVTVGIALLKKATRMGIKDILSALESGAKGVLEIALATACAGIVVGIFTLTGLGLKLSGLLISLSGEKLILLLILTMLASLVLGMGLPTAPVYIILAVLVAPTLVKMGVEPIGAHLFVLYFGIISAITPPIALAAYAGASIARANPLDASVSAFKLGIAAFLLPFMFIYSPQLLLMGSIMEITLITITSFIGIVAIATFLQGNFFGLSATILHRILLFVSSIMLVNVGPLTGIVGVSIFGLSILLILIHNKNTSKVLSSNIRTG